MIAAFYDKLKILQEAVLLWEKERLSQGMGSDITEYHAPAEAQGYAWSY